MKLNNFIKDEIRYGPLRKASPLLPIYIILLLSKIPMTLAMESFNYGTEIISGSPIGKYDYSQGLNVVKVDHNHLERQQEEIVTTFYKRMENKKKLERDHNQPSKRFSQKEFELREDLFNDQISTCASPSLVLHKSFSLLRDTCSSAAGVRGGAASLLKFHYSLQRNKISGSHGQTKHDPGEGSTKHSQSHKSSIKHDHHGHKKWQNIDNQQLSKKKISEENDGDDVYNNGNQYHPKNHEGLQSDKEHYDEDEELTGLSTEEEDDYSLKEHHHLGLLRVPCSIAINSGEDGRLRYQTIPHQNELYHTLRRDEDYYVKRTPIAAYVDTGAQVTVISVSAARRAGILHLMDRRYAGRATGVGHCKVLGRIPARHVYFFLGEDVSGSSLRDGCIDLYDEEESMVKMDGPALTVLEGTVTKGVDVLFGLDVLQDWEAEIRMGPQKSITVKKKQGRRNLLSSNGTRKNGLGKSTNSVVIPFMIHSVGNSVGLRTQKIMKERFMRERNIPNQSNYYHNSKANQFHRRLNSHESSVAMLNLEDEEEEKFFSPSASDIESDLDFLEQSSPDDNDGDMSNEAILHEVEGEIMPTTRSRFKEDEDEDDFLQDVEDDEGFVDMSGL